MIKALLVRTSCCFAAVLCSPMPAAFRPLLCRHQIERLHHALWTHAQLAGCILKA